MKLYLSCAVIALLTLSLGGCPTEQIADTVSVEAVLGVSATSGPAPLQVVVTAGDSTSATGRPLTYAWDFGDGTHSSAASTTHTYDDPGRYLISLTVSDDDGHTSVTTTEVRAAGTGAVAVIATSAESGAAPLHVQFDGTSSFAPDDTILDYFWDFGDAESSRDAKPLHIYTIAGLYTVTLRVVTNGGVEANTSATITVSIGPTDSDSDAEAQVTAIPYSNVTGGTAPLVVHFDAGLSHATGDTIASYQWVFADGTQVAGAAATYTFAEAGDYVVELRVATSSGLVDTAQTTIHVTAAADDGTPDEGDTGDDDSGEEGSDDGDGGDGGDEPEGGGGG